jgi:hypothetical protein
MPGGAVMKLVYALHSSACTEIEWDLIEDGDISDFRLCLAAGVRKENEAVAGSRREALALAHANGPSGAWALIEFTVHKADVVGWITNDGTPVTLRNPRLLEVSR